MLNLCPDCGSELPASALFCPRCGTSLDGGATAPESSPAPPREPRSRRQVARRVAPAQRRTAVAAKPTSVKDEAPGEVTDSDFVRLTEEIFPIAWIAMVVAVSYLGIYFAVDNLPGRNLLPGPGWF